MILGVNKMLKGVFNQFVTITLVAFLTGSVLLVSSCQKSEPDAKNQNSSPQAIESKHSLSQPVTATQPATPAQPAAVTPAAPATQTSPAPAAVTAPPSATAPAAVTTAPQAVQTASQPVVNEVPAQPTAVAEVTAPVNPDWVAIDINLPKAVTIGTPANFKVDNLEPPLGHPRPPFLAPKGTINVALNKPVTGSDSWPMVGKLTFVTNDDKAGTDGHYVELAPGKQYITIDLEKQCEIWALVIWHYHMQARVYHDVIVQVADDAEFTKNVKIIFNNDNDNSSEMGTGTDKSYTETNEGKLIDAKGVKGCYVRLYSNGNTTDVMNHYVEVAVYGKALE
jgi:hypothetical protein